MWAVRKASREVDDSVWNSGSQSVWIGKSSKTGGVPGWEPGSGVDIVGGLGPKGWLGLPWSGLRASGGSCNNLHQYIDQWPALLIPLHVCLRNPYHMASSAAQTLSAGRLSSAWPHSSWSFSPTVLWASLNYLPSCLHPNFDFLWVAGLEQKRSPSSSFEGICSIVSSVKKMKLLTQMHL